jgi:hypothetical protein
MHPKLAHVAERHRRAGRVLLLRHGLLQRLPNSEPSFPVSPIPEPHSTVIAVEENFNAFKLTNYRRVIDPRWCLHREQTERVFDAMA